MTLPDYDFLAAPLWLITALHIATLTLHFAAMNFLVGGLIAVVFAGFPDRRRHRIVLRFVKLFPVALAATVTLGVAPLLFLQLVYPRQVYSAAIVNGWFWLLIIPAVIAGYYLLYAASFRSENGALRSRHLLAAALVAFIYVSLAYSSIFSLAERPVLMKQIYAQVQSGFLWNPRIGDYFFRWLHMILGALTVGGFFVGLLGKDDATVYETGKRLFLWGMIAASFAGFAYLFALGPYIAPFMRTPGIWGLTIGILLSMGSLHFFFKRRFWPSGIMVFISLLTMVTARHYVRLIRLEGQFNPDSWRVATQWFPLLLFFACFVIAAALIWYMLNVFFADRKQSGE
jgi:hypothetical protein